MTDQKVACRTPAAEGVINIPAWKFEAVRRAIKAALADGEQPFKGFAQRVGTFLTEDELAKLGSLGWHSTTVKLELEVRGDVSRRPGSPQRIVWSGD